jgi:tRNA(Ile)-lysidine synthase TilS/MesJ
MQDSLTMLHVLLEIQRKAPIRFEIAAATVDPQTPEYNPVCMYVCMYVCIYIYMYVYVCMYADS